MSYQSPQGKKRLLRPHLKAIIVFTVMALLLSLRVGGVFAYTDEQIANAIYKAEGANKATYPYGIRSISCEGLNECHQVCLNTIRNNRRRFKNQNKYKDYLEFLASRYCPIGASNDPKGLNQYWLKNVRYFLRQY